MNHSPEALNQLIDDALKAIGSADPPAGMQERLVHRARAASKRASHRWLTSALALQIAAVACVLVFTVALVAHFRSAAHPANVGSESPSHIVRNDAPSVPSVPYGKTVATFPSSGRDSLLAFTRAAQNVAYPASREQPGRDLAYEEMKAPSRPAPEMPLTSQEKLLLEAARRREATTQVAELHRPVWPLRDPADDEDFQQFFTRPPVPSQPGDSQ